MHVHATFSHAGLRARSEKGEGRREKGERRKELAKDSKFEPT
jgi:hypothetical protein